MRDCFRRGAARALCAAVGLFVVIGGSQADGVSALAEKTWIHGSAHCDDKGDDNRDPPLEVFSFDADTYILRQNKCVHFEAPFIYVLFGKHTSAGVREYFGFSSWPDGSALIDLGGRNLIVMPMPGHQEESLAVYDPHTRWLLTGDSVYPGRLYVRNWQAFKTSVRRVMEFTKTHPVSAVMGTHIELTRAGTQFPAGTTYQPEEASLVLTQQDLLRLDELLQQAGDEPKEIVTKRFVVSPVGRARP